ncbi:hypothetical protein GCM10010324_04790 [Streptomyces hiroshimensis]|uniref:Uncharacterized protein n=1 Tax=Streptomyces hiroshimensis TaxID=66424 RepID=A0ABQ2Y4B6_9ACTN|nr:hypothetical protein GCM10010324_04790 [Streptomyces hiroshimensis]
MVTRYRPRGGPDAMLCPRGGHSIEPLRAGVYRCDEHGVTVVRKPPWPPTPVVRAVNAATAS